MARCALKNADATFASAHQAQSRDGLVCLRVALKVHCLGGQPAWGLCWSHGKSQHGLVHCSVGTGVWLVAEMLPVAAVTPKNLCATERVPCRRCASEVGCKKESGTETGFTLPLRQLFFPWTLCSEMAPKTTKTQAPFCKQPSER